MLRRYLFREVLGPFLGWVGLLCVIFFVMAFLRSTDFLLGSAVTAADVVRFTLALLPQFLVQGIPVSLLLAILLGLGRLSEDREVVAMQALGISPFEFVRGPLMLGALLSLVLGVLANSLQPWGMRTLRRVAHDIIRRNLVSDVKPGVFHDELRDLTLYAQGVDGGGRWTNVFLYDGRDPENPLLAFGRRGTVENPDVLEQVAFVLEDGSLHQARQDTEEYSLVTFSRADFRADVGETFFRKNNFRSTRDEQTVFDALEARRAALSRGESPVDAEVTLHWRLGQVLMPLAFAVLGTPLALSRRRGARGWSFFFTVGAYLAFYLTWRTASQFAERGEFPVWLSGQLPNVLFFTIGLLLLWRVTRRGVA
ncbi:MAG: LPS export ABC transporter permease LptF [Myxococcaceae bacterium]|nr:LPS export ABC transporter permease LptF [Myxococcaceae bacterium]